MNVKSLVTVCVLLFMADLSVAQSVATDPLSGTWTGSMGRTEKDRSPIYVDLKYDGTAVTGTITGPPSPGLIKTGTFDPATGALKFHVSVQNAGDNLVLFEGTAARGIAAGRVTINNETGTFSMTKKGAEISTAAPQSTTGDTSAAALRRSFGQVSGWVTKAADLVPADKYTYRPAPSVRTFGQLIAHIADSYTYFCAVAAGRQVEWSDAIEKASTDKATVVQKLKTSLEGCGAAYGAGQTTVAAPRPEREMRALVDNVAHTSLHYGNAITYMRMLGLVPPSS